MNKIAKRKYNLWKKDPHCYWCGCKLKWSKATADHFYQRTKIGAEKRPIQGIIVLACKKCNNQRQADAFNEMNKVQQWVRNKTIPKLKRAWSFKKITPLYARVWILYYYLTNGLKNI